MCRYTGEADMGDCEAISDPETVDAVGKATEGLEYVERARGHLYAFHQLVGRADFPVRGGGRPPHRPRAPRGRGVAVAQRRCGATSLWRNVAVAQRRCGATSLWRNVVGRDVLEGRCSFEVVEHFDDDYDAARAEVLHLETRLVGGRRHGHEEALRRRRREEHPPFLNGR
jgi:hypothetical protein